MTNRLLEMPALNGEVVTQFHANICAELGHASHSVDGTDSGSCPRCGDVTGTPQAVKSSGRVQLRGVEPAYWEEWSREVSAWFDDHSQIISDRTALRTVSDWESAGWFQITGPRLRHGYSVGAVDIMTDALAAYADAERQGQYTATEDMRSLIALAMWASRLS